MWMGMSNKPYNNFYFRCLSGMTMVIFSSKSIFSVLYAQNLIVISVKKEINAWSK